VSQVKKGGLGRGLGALLKGVDVDTPAEPAADNVQTPASPETARAQRPAKQSVARQTGSDKADAGQVMLFLRYRSMK
jgi:hypothetical protein